MSHRESTCSHDTGLLTILLGQSLGFMNRRAFLSLLPAPLLAKALPDVPTIPIDREPMWVFLDQDDCDLWLHYVTELIANALCVPHEEVLADFRRICYTKVSSDLTEVDSLLKNGARR